MKTKIEILRDLMNRNKWEDAIKFASKFPRLGNEKKIILLARDCINYPDFYLQIGKNVNECIDAGKQALLKKYQTA